MEYLDGVPASKLLRVRPYPPQVALAMVAELARALDAIEAGRAQDELRPAAVEQQQQQQTGGGSQPGAEPEEQEEDAPAPDEPANPNRALRAAPEVLQVRVERV